MEMANAVAALGFVVALLSAICSIMVFLSSGYPHYMPVAALGVGLVIMCLGFAMAVDRTQRPMSRWLSRLSVCSSIVSLPLVIIALLENLASFGAMALGSIALGFVFAVGSGISGKRMPWWPALGIVLAILAGLIVPLFFMTRVVVR